MELFGATLAAREPQQTIETLVNLLQDDISSADNDVRIAIADLVQALQKQPRRRRAHSPIQSAPCWEARAHCPTTLLIPDTCPRAFTPPPTADSGALSHQEALEYESYLLGPPATGGTITRRYLRGYERLIEALMLVGLPAEQWIGGSFVSSKVGPCDLDLVGFCTINAFEALAPELRTLIKRTSKAKRPHAITSTKRPTRKSAPGHSSM